MTELQPAAGPPRAPHAYRRRRPEETTLHRVVRENLQTLYAAVEHGFDGAAPLPPFVRKQLEGYVSCGLLVRGFALLECQGCRERRLVAFSCKSRSFCPSCMGRRSAQMALNLLEHVLPQSVPLRQFVLTLPFPLRARVAYDGPLLGAVCRLFVDSVLGWYRRGCGAPGGQGGAVAVVQRSSSDLKLNPHVHAVLLDGLFVPDAAGNPTFRPADRLDTTDTADILQVARVRILRFLVRRGIVEPGCEELTVVSDELVQREPALAQLARAAVSGLPPAGPELRRKPWVVPLRGRPGVEIQAPLCVAEAGFSLHAATTAGAEDLRARQALLNYVLRPPLSHERIQPGPDGLVSILLKNAFRDGTTAIDLDPLSLLSRLAASVHPPRFNAIRYQGVLAAHAKWRPLVVPPPPPATPDAPRAHTPPLPERPERPPTHRCGYRPYLELLQRSFPDDLAACTHCGGRLRLLALIKDPKNIARYLRHLGHPTEPLPLAAARGPPYFATARRFAR